MNENNLITKTDYFFNPKPFIKINGKKIDIKSPHQSILSGIGMVHQHFMLVENFSVLENIILGFEGELIFGKKL